ncbi:MAG: type II toxin-antitoxin system RelE/ParE family toxin [Spirochaetaceae bacterium]|jgi:mRNA interferase RelE/StbE|nr:type II toxin-antitoxin system RelE/ParE family toxin [Spirochaetaceae bacterium]
MNVIYSEIAVKQLAKLDKHIQSRILIYMDEIAALEDPFSRGHGLTGNEKGYWRFRVDDMRIICRINEVQLEILVVRLGNRREVYRHR